MRAQQLLLDWYEAEGRKLPWRRTRDPYRVIVSEFMLQQTQVERVIPKYRSWLRAFPTWKTLAKAPLKEVLAQWSGLGYNSRAVRLQRLAQHVVEYGLPDDEKGLAQLPGIGPYTAGAIRVFAFNEPGACIDVNIERVITRALFTKRQRPSAERVKQAFIDSFPEGCARDWGNAFMDLGSSHCTATAPACEKCPLQRVCKSRGERPEERAVRERRRQSSFLHSNRWWRGQVLKALTRRAQPEEQLYTNIAHHDKRAFKKALTQLREEGIVRGERWLSVGAAR